MFAQLPFWRSLVWSRSDYLSPSCVLPGGESPYRYSPSPDHKLGRAVEARPLLSRTRALKAGQAAFPVLVVQAGGSAIRKRDRQAGRIAQKSKLPEFLRNIQKGGLCSTHSLDDIHQRRSARR